ncbi:hypothetical protein CRENBAI_015406, partial [Crenichthys baileyi]
NWPKLDLADGKQESASDRWVQQQMEEAMRHLPADLEVLPSLLLLELMEREAVQRHSPPASMETPARSTFPSAGEEVGPMPADVKDAASNPASSSATVCQARCTSAQAFTLSSPRFGADARRDGGAVNTRTPRILTLLELPSPSI